MDVAVPARTAPADTRVLFLCPPIQDYLADGVFHGLRLLLGASVVEVPRRDFMYASYPEDRRSALYGRGFSLYCMLEDVDAARDTAIADALDGRFRRSSSATSHAAGARSTTWPRGSSAPACR